MPRTAAVILAAGLGTRMKSRLPKVLHPLCGRPMLAYVVDAARDATGARPLVVHSEATAKIREVFSGVADFALQERPHGTADAVRAALSSLPAGTDEIVVLNGDKPLLTAAVLVRLLQRHRAESAALTLLTFRVPPSAPHGRVVRAGDGTPVRIVERMDDPERTRLESFEANSGVYAFRSRWLVDALVRVRPSPASGELYLTQLVEMALEDGERTAAVDATPDSTTLVHVKDRVDLAAAETELRRVTNERHLRNGVTMEEPSSAYIDATVEIAEDVTLGPNVILRGETRVGRDTVIEAGSEIFDTVIGERCRIRASVLESSEVEDDVQIGPFAHLRPGSSIGRGARLGNFAEVKKSRIGAGTQQHHFSYIGDATIGERVNIAAGTVTANYDGERKLRTTIGDGAFIGVDTMLVAPLEIGEGAYTGAGAVVTKDVPPGKLAVGVPARIRERRAKRNGSDADSSPPSDTDGVTLASTVQTPESTADVSGSSGADSTAETSESTAGTVEGGRGAP